MRIADFLVAVTLGLFAAALPTRACELALLLAVDVSGSIDPVEFRFQMDGMADALEDPTIADALVQGHVALSIVQWSGEGEQKISQTWTRMLSHNAVARLAARIRNTPREWSTSKTAIGDLISSSLASFSAVPDCKRRVIDISGDGQNNAGTDPAFQRGRAKAQGITINGLAIDRVGRSVTQYYRNHVITGRESFVITATGYGDYPRAIEQKLFREIIRPAS